MLKLSYNMTIRHTHHSTIVSPLLLFFAGVADAEAFLHERLGDLEAALRLHMAAVDKTNSRLVTALTTGRIPVLQLPGGLAVCSAAAAGVSRQGSGVVSKALSAGSAAGNVNSSSSSSSSVEGEHVQWGLGPLLQQLQAAQDAVQLSGNATPEVTQPAAAAADVAASLLQQLAPTSSSHTQQHLYQQQHQAQLQQQQHPYLLSHHGGAAAGSSAAAAHRPCCVCVDLHKAWMAELSPRLKLKGLGYSAVYSPGHSGSGSTAGTSNAAAAAALAELPQELLAAWQALQAALAFCKRNTTSSSSSGGSGSAAGRSQRHSSSGGKQHEADDTHGGKQLWFGLMDVYVARVRSISHNTPASSASASPESQQQQQQQQSQQQLAVTPQLLKSLAAAAAGQLDPAELPSVLLSAAAALASCVAHDLFSLLLDEVVCVMADHLPLLDIVGRVLQQHGSERFGEFRSTLLGLFGATAYESAIMQAANRWVGVGRLVAVTISCGLLVVRVLSRSETQVVVPTVRSRCDVGRVAIMMVQMPLRSVSQGLCARCHPCMMRSQLPTTHTEKPNMHRMVTCRACPALHCGMPAASRVLWLASACLLSAARRLITGDAFAAVRRCYLLRQLARQPLHDEEQRG
jgi:hypothetical protein